MSKGTPPTMTYEQYCEAVRCHKIHTETPTLTQLARQWNIAESSVGFAVRRGIKQYDRRMHEEKYGNV